MSTQVGEIVQWLRGLEAALEKTLSLGITREERAGLEPRRGIYSGIADDVAARWGRESEPRPGGGARSTQPMGAPGLCNSLGCDPKDGNLRCTRIRGHIGPGDAWSREAHHAREWFARGFELAIDKYKRLSSAAVQLVHHRRCACSACEAAQATTHEIATGVDAVVRGAAPRLGELPNEWRPLVGRWRPASVTDVELAWDRAADGGPALPPERPTLTVEMCGKWYSLWVVHPGGSSIEVPFHDLRLAMPDDVVYIDHAPRPAAVAALARYRGWDVCELAMEIIVGRWVEERHGYGDPDRARLGLDTHVEE